MPAQFSLENGNIAFFKVSGKLSKEELIQAQNECEAAIQEIGRISILIMLDNFQGWEKAKGWEDFSFAERNDPYINKIAIVGDKKWEDLAYAFTAEGMRPVPIKYFDEGREGPALNWLLIRE